MKIQIKVFPNSVNPLYHFINEINGIIDKINGNKYLILFTANES